MDRRQQKTRQAIFRAFSTLLETRRYENITVQAIIDAANIGRSTFYAHFETRDALLKALCEDVFLHVFYRAAEDTDASFGDDGQEQLCRELGHVLYHLGENRNNLRGLLRGESGRLLLGYLKGYLAELFSRHLIAFDRRIPEDFLLHFLSGSFAETILWWMGEDCKTPPEQVASYFMAAVYLGYRCFPVFKNM